MQRRITYSIVILIIVLVFSAIFSLAYAKYLNTYEVKTEEVTGSFTLILYGGRHVNDLEAIALLDREGDQYEFEPYAPEFDYKIKKGVSAGDALKESRKFVSFHNAFWRSQLSMILDEKGTVIGYEMRPLYRPFVYGRDDLLEVYYRIKKSKVIVYIQIKPEIFNKPFFGDHPGGSIRGH